jgi:hypothetical protein
MDEVKDQFDLQEHIKQWKSRVKAEPCISEFDMEELHDHLQNIINELQKIGLKDDEAFIIAVKRLDFKYDYREEFGNVNKEVFQMRRSLIIMAGVLIYFLVYYFIFFTSQLLFIGIINIGINIDEAIEWVFRYIITWHFISLLFFVSIYFFERKTVIFLEGIKFKPLHAITYLLITLLFFLINSCLLPFTNSLIGENVPLRSNFIHIYTIFDYSFPLLICICFIIIYFKYYKMTKF